jgi:hypothetical protein
MCPSPSLLDSRCGRVTQKFPLNRPSGSPGGMRRTSACSRWAITRGRTWTLPATSSKGGSRSIRSTRRPWWAQPGWRRCRTPPGRSVPRSWTPRRSPWRWSGSWSRRRTRGRWAGEALPRGLRLSVRRGRPMVRRARPSAGRCRLSLRGAARRAEGAPGPPNAPRGGRGHRGGRGPLPCAGRPMRTDVLATPRRGRRRGSGQGVRQAA